MPQTIIAWDSFQARARPLPRLPRRARGSLEQPPKTSPNGANNDCPRLRCRRQPSDQPQDREGGRPGSASNANRARRRGDRMNTTAAHVVARRLKGDMAARRWRHTAMTSPLTENTGTRPPFAWTKVKFLRYLIVPSGLGEISRSLGCCNEVPPTGPLT